MSQTVASTLAAFALICGPYGLIHLAQLRVDPYARPIAFWLAEHQLRRFLDPTTPAEPNPADLSTR